MSDKQSNIIIGLDVGTTKICTIVGEYGTHYAGKRSTSKLNIIGMGNVPSLGLKKGMVVNIDRAVFSIKNSLKEVKKVTNIDCKDVYVSIAGSHIYSFNNRISTTIKGGTITTRDVERVLESAKTVIVPLDRQILHMIPHDFKVDNITGVKDPVGMSGSRLEASVHIVTGVTSAIQNLTKCVEGAGINVKGIILQPLASSMAVLSEEERNMGVMVLDIGGGTSDIAVWKKGSLIHSQVIPLGGNHFTNDLSIALSTSYGNAEKIKINYGGVLLNKTDGRSHITVQGRDNSEKREVPQGMAIKVLGLRAHELFRVVSSIIDEQNLRKDIVAGVVLTGGGARIRGLNVLGESVLDMPCRTSMPLHLKQAEGIIQYPEFSTAIGLLMVAFRQKMEEKNRININRSPRNDLVNKINESLKSIFREIF